MTKHSKSSFLVAPQLRQINEAAVVLKGVVEKTGLLENIDVNQQLGCRLFIKAENQQRTGSFKIRGAYNRIRQMNKQKAKAGAITYSSGNHGQAVACAAKMFGTNALIVMPDTAPEQKIERTRALGADVSFFNRDRENKDEVVATLQSQTGRVIVPPSEDVRVLAGAGTVGLEIIDQMKAANAEIDIVLVPCGGGGLTAVTSLLFGMLNKNTAIYAVEPELFDDTARSMAAKKRVSNPSGRQTICDAIMTDRPGELTFSINQKHLDGVLTVSDEEVCNAMQFAFEHYKTIIEPGGAVGLAAVLAAKLDFKDKNIVVVATGGNIDSKNFCKLLSSSSGG